jgi:hypothetical protein
MALKNSSALQPGLYSAGALLVYRQGARYERRDSMSAVRRKRHSR